MTVIPTGIAWGLATRRAVLQFGAGLGLYTTEGPVLATNLKPSLS
jgi:hypothetical protein